MQTWVESGVLQHKAVYRGVTFIILLAVSFAVISCDVQSFSLHLLSSAFLPLL